MSPTAEVMAEVSLGSDPIWNSSELRGLCRRSHLGSRTCVRGITNSSSCAGLSIRVSPSHPYNAGKAGPGWGGGWIRGNVYDACRGYVVYCFFVTMLPDTVDDSSTSTRCLYLSPSQLCLIKRISNFKGLSYLNLGYCYCVFF